MPNLVRAQWATYRGCPKILSSWGLQRGTDPIEVADFCVRTDTAMSASNAHVIGVDLAASLSRRTCSWDIARTGFALRGWCETGCARFRDLLSCRGKADLPYDPFSGHPGYLPYAWSSDHRDYLRCARFSNLRDRRVGAATTRASIVRAPRLSRPHTSLRRPAIRQEP